MASYSISATSGTVTTKLVVSEKYQSIDNNQTELSWALYMWNTGSWYSYDSKNAFNVTIDGTVVWNTSSYGRVSLPNGMSESAAILMGSGSNDHECKGRQIGCSILPLSRFFCSVFLQCGSF